MNQLPHVLLVDDEEFVLLALSRMLRGRFEITTALGGQEALQHLSGATQFQVVVSDMRMPGIDGVQVLAHARRTQPHATRLILSGHSDLAAVARAISESNLFRFLFKPSKGPELIATLDAAVEQHRLVVAEKELLERTVTGSVDVLSEVLALTNPGAHGRARRVRRIVDALATELKLPSRWALEVAASLSQVGAVLLPPSTASRWANGQVLSEDEQAMVHKMPAVADQLLRHIPRFEPVRAILSALGETSADQTIEARILRVALALEQTLSRGVASSEALVWLQSVARPGDEAVLDACARMKGLVFGQGASQTVTIENLREGMVLASDVRTRAGALLISRGHEVTYGLMTALRNYARTVGVAEPLSVEFIEKAELAAA